jgi:hypothetical protein
VAVGTVRRPTIWFSPPSATVSAATPVRADRDRRDGARVHALALDLLAQGRAPRSVVAHPADPQRDRRSASGAKTVAPRATGLVGTPLPPACSAKPLAEHGPRLGAGKARRGAPRVSNV